MSFASPFALVALLVVPATLAFAIAIRRRPSRNAVAFTNLDVLASVLERRRSWRPWLPVALLLLALALASGALARPHVQLSSRVDNATVVLLVDVSGSMRAVDVEPTRLDAATAAMRTFLDRLPRRFQVGLVQFSSRPDVLVPPSRDRDRIRQSLTYLQADAGTAIGDGLAVATNLVERSLAGSGATPTAGGTAPGAIVLLSDGTQSVGRLEALEGARLAQRAGIPVNTVALGTVNGVVTVPPGTVTPVPPDPKLMHAIAVQTGGRTFTASTASELSSVFGGLGSSIGSETRSREVTSWFAAAAAAALLAALGAGRLLAGPFS
jgi:Ca-activated chloride channel family protein